MLVAARPAGSTVGIPLMGTSGIDYVYLPLIAAVAVLLLALVLRWSMQSRSARGARVADPAQGLLIGVASATPEEAERIRRMLRAAGLHATSRAVASRRQVLVWPADADRAMRMVASYRSRRG